MSSARFNACMESPDRSADRPSSYGLRTILDSRQAIEHVHELRRQRRIEQVRRPAVMKRELQRRGVQEHALESDLFPQPFVRRLVAVFVIARHGMADVAGMHADLV